MLNKSKIYSIQPESKEGDLIEIETIILNGLYRFSILGINQKNSTDTKDRIYSALRSQKLVNLKSDNKKITVSLLPTNIDKKANIYDLGIALGCLTCMNHVEINEDIIAIGELSILGNIISSKFLLKSIYSCIKNNIKTIVCTQDDFNIIDKYQNNIQNLIKNHNIKFISSNTLGDLIQKIKNKEYSIPKHINSEVVNINVDYNHFLKKINLNILKITLALCTRRSIFIENNKNCYIKKYIGNLTYYNIKLNNLEILKMSNVLNISDEQILEKYIYPKISILDSQIEKKDLNFLLDESFFGFNLIEDFLNMSNDSLYTIRKFNKSSIFCFYNSCPCGNSNIFFNSIGNNKCFCLQRNILKYRQKIQKIENGFFDFHINNTNEDTVEHISDDYLKINSIISKFRNTEVEINEGTVSKVFIKNYTDIYERSYIDTIIQLAKDITKLNHITGEGDTKLNQENINLAIDLLRKDF